MSRHPNGQLRSAPATVTADGHWKISTTYRRLRVLGFAEHEAGDFTAYVSGIAIGLVPWTIRELTHLLFLRELARTRGEWSGADDRASTDVGDGRRLPRRAPRYLNQPDCPITLQLLLRATLGRTAQMPERPAGAPDEQGREGR
ncbi:MAG: hypothetical protein ACRDGD_09315 [Candidatus Limnocylindria bacterium]